jgi:hypothetical protein
MGLNNQSRTPATGNPDLEKKKSDGIKWPDNTLKQKEILGCQIIG